MAPKTPRTKQAPRGKPFVKGDPRSGRPKGSPNKASLEIKAFSQGVLLDDPAYVASLKRRLKSGEAPHMETLLAHYGYGKPVDRVESGKPGDFSQLTDEQINEELRKAAEEPLQ